MFDSTVSGLASQWFDEYSRLAYWLARRWSRRLLACRARSCSADELEELAQDAVCRGFDRFANPLGTVACHIRADTRGAENRAAERKGAPQAIDVEHLAFVFH